MNFLSGGLLYPYDLKIRLNFVFFFPKGGSVGTKPKIKLE